MMATVCDAYFDALDRGDAERAASSFAADAVLCFEPGSETFEGADAIQRCLASIIDESLEMSHEVTSLVVDEVNRKCAADLRYRDRLKNGKKYDMVNCNLFDFDADWKLKRVRVWLGNEL